MTSGQQHREEASQGKACHRHRTTAHLGGQEQESLFGRGEPVGVAGGPQLVHRGAVTGQHGSQHREPLGGQPFGDGAHLERGAAEPV